MIWLHLAWLAFRAVTTIVATGIEVYVLYVMVTDHPRLERAWRVLRGRA